MEPGGPGLQREGEADRKIKENIYDGTAGEYSAELQKNVEFS